MAARMLGFVATDAAMPDKRKPAERARDFDEIYREFAATKAAEQANRCSQCGIPFCQSHCPLHNNIPDWLKLTAEGRLQEAWEISSATNTFPEICGRICPQDRLCEGNCTIEQSGHGTVTIGAIERYLTETAFTEGWVAPRRPSQDLPLSIGIIGSGPAGLAAAEDLRARGWQVHVYDRHDRAGGLMIYGIPGFKLEKSVVQRRTDLLQAQGVVFHLSTPILPEAQAAAGGGLSFASLRARHDAVLIATGVYKPRPLDVPGLDLPGVVPALDYLIASNRIGLGDPVPAFTEGLLDAAGKDVVVIGGGDTAMDCVRTAIRQGARSVRCLYRRDRANMPGSAREVAHAEEEGVIFQWLSAPARFLGDGKVEQVEAQQMRLVSSPSAGSSGRQEPRPVAGATQTLPADLVILALGFEPEDLPGLFEDPALKLSRAGTLSVSFKTMMTSLPGVFAAGDIIRGASLVVWGIRDGRDAARSIHGWLSARLAEREAAALAAVTLPANAAAGQEAA